jgi:hypothetical protein
MSRIQILIMSFVISSASYGQGLVAFYNTPTTLVSGGPGGGPPAISPPDIYYFGLLISPSGAPGSFVFSGVYATNQSIPGLFSGGAAVAVPGWAPGTTRWYQIEGWSANIGHDWNPQWPQIFDGYPVGSALGLSYVGSGVAGGPTSTGTLPALALFDGGSSTLQSGFSLYRVVPEPSCLALAAVGSLTVVASGLWRKKKSERSSAHRKS